ncbi:MAG: hypothetical protein Q4C40_06955 [Eubacteriales bacterium]|nr:hypothetical protein [Eubacteriales bacterium]
MESNQKRRNLPTLLQLQYLRELEQMEVSRGFISLIAERCGVSHVAVSKYIKSCVESGILTEDYAFTEYGCTWLHGYLALIQELEGYLRDIGVPEQEISENVRTLVESTEQHTLQAMIHSHTRAQQKQTAKRRTWISEDFRKEVLQHGNCRVQFKLYRLNGTQRNAFSMANHGFDKRAYVLRSGEREYLELTIQDMNANSRVDGHLMCGHLETLKYEMDGLLQVAPLEDRRLRIPLEACRFHRGQGGELTGMIPVTLTCSVGRIHMPESTALLTFWM